MVEITTIEPDYDEAWDTEEFWAEPTTNYNPHQARDKDGKFGSGGGGGVPDNTALVTKVSAGIDASPLGPTHKRRAKDEFHEATKRMPVKALAHLDADLKAVNVHASTDGVHRGTAEAVVKAKNAELPGWFQWVKKQIPETSAKSEELQVEAMAKGMKARGVAACYTPHDGTVRVDSLDTHHQAREVIAHELAHVIDHKDRYSGKPEWKAAFAKEIDKPDAPLSEYARTHPREAFAEFARLLYTGDVKQRVGISKKFPDAAKFFEDHELWAS